MLFKEEMSWGRGAGEMEQQLRALAALAGRNRVQFPELMPSSSGPPITLALGNLTLLPALQATVGTCPYPHTDTHAHT